MQLIKYKYENYITRLTYIPIERKELFLTI